jgi:hypothetical protein
MGWCNGRSGIVIDLGEPRRIVGMAFSPIQIMADGLPASYRVEGSTDGSSFTELKAVEGALPYVYRQGGRVYAGGGYGWMECAWAPAEVRYLRWRPTAPWRGMNTWFLDELFVFEEALGTDHTSKSVIGGFEAEREAILRDLTERNTRFTYADRWISAALLRGHTRVYDDPPAYPRYNEHLRIVGARVPLGIRRFRPKGGEAIVVSRALVADTAGVLRDAYGDGIGWERTDYPHYAAFHITRAADTDARPPLWWNGFLPLKMRIGME